MCLTQRYVHHRRQRLRAIATIVAASHRAKHRRPRHKRTLMDWAVRDASLTTHEFISRYRVDRAGFQEILEKIAPHLPRMRPHIVGQIRNELKLSCTLRWLAGGAYQDICDLHGIHKSTCFEHIKQVLYAIDKAYELPLMGMLKRRDMDALQKLADAYDAKTHGVVAGCIGAIDGLAVKIERRVVAGEVNPSAYKVHKGFYALNCQVICDAHRRVLWLSAKTCGSTHDSAALGLTELGELLQDATHPLNASDLWIAGDDAYVGPANKTDSLLTPFQGRNLSAADDAFNFYQSKLRIEIECTFGQLVHRWGLLQRKLSFDNVHDATTCVSVMCKLHNIAARRNSGTNHRGRVQHDRYQDTERQSRTAGDRMGADWAEWGSLGRDDGGLNCAPEDRPRPPPRQRQRQRLRDVLRDRLRAAGWNRPDRSTYRGYRDARDGITVPRE